MKIRYGVMLLLFVPLLVVGLLFPNPGSSDTAEKLAVVIEIKGAIGPATVDYFERSLDKAIKRNAALIIIQMDTPGGLDSSMRDIIQAILSSPIPVVTYVSPSGARAASAGTYILYASHVAAMAPATNLGSATPVQIGGTPELPTLPKKKKKQEQDKKDEEQVLDNQNAMRQKVVNDAVAYIRGLAQLRGRNADWAEQAVRKAANLPATVAQEKNVIDLVARDISHLLSQLQGKQVDLSGQQLTLNTKGMVLEYIEPDWRSRLLSILTNPNVAYILMLLGIYGLIFEFSNPGAIVPGVVGAICLLLALFAFQALPVNYAGAALMVLGIVLMLAEAFAPSFGALGIGGVVAFVIGSIILMDTDVPGFGVSRPLIGAVALVSSAVFTFILFMAVKARQRPVVSGQEQLIDDIAVVMDDFDSSGIVRTHGEQWLAKTDVPLHKGQQVKVSKVEGLTLWVQPQTNEKQENQS